MESSQHDAIQSKKDLPDFHVHNKHSHSLLSWKQKSQYYIPILAIVCVHFTSNAEIFKMILESDTINIWFKFFVSVVYTEILPLRVCHDWTANLSCKK